MASTYTTNLQLEKVTTGEKAGLWGTITNTNLEILEQAASGYVSIDVAAADVTLVLNDGATGTGKNLFYVLTVLIIIYDIHMIIFTIAFVICFNCE